MIFEQYYLACLSHASYLVGDETTGQAVIVDPQRDVSAYVADAAARSLTITQVIETHFHADFVSGHLELAAATGAEICYGALAEEPDYPIRRLGDGELLQLGQVSLEVRSTPGHTPESICLVVAEDAGPAAVLTGDTLFIGDVGRPDLIASSGRSAEEMARLLYRSLHERLLDLPDATRVYPAHGAGSACGKHLSTETSSTIGEQRRLNYALVPMAEEEFVRVVTEGQATSPAYFAYSARRNRSGGPLLDEQEPLEALDLAEVLARQREGAIVLDARDATQFGGGHLPGAINVGIDGRFAEYAGDALRPERPIVLVCDDGREPEARIRLGRIGFDHVVGYLDAPHVAFAGIDAPIERSSRLSAPVLAERLAGGAPLQLLDVRQPGEFAAGAIERASNLPLARLLDALDELDPSRPVVAYCAGGYRSSIAASVISAAGHVDVSDLLGGFDAWSLLVDRRR